MKISGIALMLGAMILLVGPGALYNNYVNSDLVVQAASFALTCPGFPDVTCQSNIVVGCQQSSAVCTLQGNSISFLSGNSPFTSLLNGNIFGLFTNLNGNPSAGQGAQTSWSGTHGPFDLVGNPVYYSADCIGTEGAGSGSQQKWVPTKCTATNTDNSNMTYANSPTWTNWNTNWNSTISLHFFQLGNATFPQACGWIAQINYTALSNGPGFTYFACTYDKSNVGVQGPPTKPTYPSWGILFAMPVTYGAMPAGSSHQRVFAQLENWWTLVCVPGAQNLGLYLSIQCSQFSSGFKGITLPGTSVTFVPNSLGGVVFGFLLGVILLLLGLGLQIGLGGGVSAGTNPQGSKLAQVLGIGLILWTFLYSEFSSWFTTGLLPYGLDGTFGIASIAITGSFWFGVLSWATAGESGDG